MNEYLNKMKQTADQIRLKSRKNPRIAIVLGSGLGNLSNYMTDRVEFPYEDIPNFPKTTVPGHEGK